MYSHGLDELMRKLNYVTFAQVKAKKTGCQYSYELSNIRSKTQQKTGQEPRAQRLTAHYANHRPLYALGTKDLVPNILINHGGNDTNIC